MAFIGYARVSTGDQTLDLQRDALREAGCIDVYAEYASGARVQRRLWPLPYARAARVIPSWCGSSIA